MPVTTQTLDFTLYLAGPRLGDDDIERAYDAGLDDASFGAVEGTDYAAFHRRAASLPVAVLEAIRALERALPGVRVRAVSGDDLATASEIAERVGRTRESVRLLIEGQRGPGGFPPAVPWVSAGRTRLYEWREVVAWFSQALGEEVGDDSGARFIAALNAALAIRGHAGALAGPAERETIAEILREDVELLSTG